MINTVKNYDDLNIACDVLFVSSKLAFTTQYLRSHYCRIMRGMSTAGEVETLRDVFGCGGFATGYLMRKFQDGLYLHMRLLDQSSGVDSSAPNFDVTEAVNSSPLYGGMTEDFEDGFLIFDSMRDSPWTQCGSRTIGISSDGNEKLVRQLTEVEKNSPKLRKTKGPTKKQQTGTVRRYRFEHRFASCSPKVPRRAKSFTSGLFVTVRCNNPTDEPIVIREVREMVNSESHLHREAALRNCVKTGVVKTWFRDLACTCSWVRTVEKPPKLFLDRFHQRNHVRPQSKRSLNPSWGGNRAFLEKLGIRNTSVSEQLNGVLKKCAPYSRQLSRCRYRCFWRHYAICQNKKQRERCED